MPKVTQPASGKIWMQTRPAVPSIYLLMITSSDPLTTTPCLPPRAGGGSPPPQEAGVRASRPLVNIPAHGTRPKSHQSEVPKGHCGQVHSNLQSQHPRAGTEAAFLLQPHALPPFSSGARILVPDILVACSPSPRVCAFQHMAHSRRTINA